MKINHNISAQLANVSLKKTENRISTSLERLSSGYKITKAADDSAGLAISNKMRAQIRALDRASRNAEDGTSIIETADGALGEIEDILQRVRELCVQAANDTYNIDDRSSIQAEMSQMLDEVDRIASTTEFNGKGLLNGDASRTVSSNIDAVKPISASMSVEAGDYKFSIDSVATAASIAGVTYQIPTEGVYQLDINKVTIDIEPTDTDASVQQKIIEVCDMMNISVSDFNATSKSMTLTTNAVGRHQSLEVDYPDGDSQSAHGENAVITLDTSGSGDNAGFATSASYIATGNNIIISDNSGFEIQLELPRAERYDAGRDSDVTLTIFDAGYMTIQIGANEHQNLALDFPDVSTRTLCLRDNDGISQINLCTQKGASYAIEAVDNAINTISAARSRLGAYQNRLESTIGSLDISNENMTDSMSRITDTDMAAEMTEYTQLTVLEQAATSMLSQANTRTQTVMSLLQAM